jgi:GDP-L-fucose synthase
LKLLITGAGGFLGKYLSQDLAEHNIHAFTKQELNLSNPDSVHSHFKNNWYDAVIHCGSAGRYTPTAINDEIMSNNLAAILNLLSYQQSFGRLINIGTGAEFDVTQDIENINEDEIFNRTPVHSYGLSKNIIARNLVAHTNCVTLRLFGCFDNSEDQSRLFKKVHQSLVAKEKFTVQDRMFDTISAADFSSIIKSVLDQTITHKNINCVYAEKFSLVETLKLYSDTHGLDSSLIVSNGTGLNYTGSGAILEKYNLPLLGLKESLLRY